ncbi:hypothetical protein F7725_023449 [Dissostichus mawsoni]|uniref:Uncharacterized protein n=1 Tax=Dissostichus mawsoni TaxID=36200 RepID=A0A7J5Z0Q9_DISMA|nr:hypothetical protein F7725_023449 [Dissostichus mawsoni]
MQSDGLRRNGAKHPETLSSTKLRKHISTLSTVLNLKDNEMDILANFLGHDIRVHRQYYRLPEGTLQLAKVSKVLLALQQGRLADFKGMSLDQIQIDPNETTKKRSWTHAEVKAVENTLMTFIKSGKVPGKFDCIACITASPEALMERSWTAVKFYVKNRITALQRESARRIY